MRILWGTLAWITALSVSAVFVYPFYWMAISSFRTQEAVLTEPLALWPEAWRLDAYRSLAEVGGVPLWRYALNSVAITGAATLIGVTATAMGAYALYRAPRLPGFGLVRYGFLLTIMYPNMLLVIPLYFVVYYLGLLGTYAGIVLAIAIVPLTFFVFVQFFASIPRELMDAAEVDGASEWQTLRRVVLPIARPILLTATLIAVLLNWQQWFQVLVISTSPDTYSLPVALVSLNSEYGVNFQATMALATLTCLPVVVVFVLTQRNVMSGFVAGAVKG